MSRFPEHPRVSETSGGFTLQETPVLPRRGWSPWPRRGPSAARPVLPPNTPTFFGLTDGDTNLWCPSLQEVSATFHSLGAHSPALQPLGPIQHTGR